MLETWDEGWRGEEWAARHTDLVGSTAKIEKIGIFAVFRGNARKQLFKSSTTKGTTAS